MGNEFKKYRNSFLFGLLFFLVGLLSAYAIAGHMVAGYLSSSNWVEVPVNIHNVELVSNHGDSTTYSIDSDYSYEFDGIKYQGDHVSLSTGSDSFGKYWRELERSLRADQKGNEAFAFVNPDDPTEAVLDRTLRWSSVLVGLVFLIAFSGVGGVMMWTSLKRET